MEDMKDISKARFQGIVDAITNVKSEMENKFKSLITELLNQAKATQDSSSQYVISRLNKDVPVLYEL